MSSPFHPGEIAVQDLAGVRKNADRVGAIVRKALPEAAQDFLREQPIVLAGFADAQGKVWCSIITGKPGFLWAFDESTVQIDAPIRPGDPLLGVVDEGHAVGLLSIDPATRRRMRVNGRLQWSADGDFQVAANQVYSNCPKYIQAREWVPADTHVKQQPARISESLAKDQIALIENADTFFIASVHADQGADCSHRGGVPGFVTVTSPTTLKFPDYSGNNMFNTLGNLSVNPACGLLFVDFETGLTLQLTGRASVKFAPGPRSEDRVPGRYVEFQIEQAISLPDALPLRWTFLEASPFNPQ